MDGIQQAKRLLNDQELNEIYRRFLADTFEVTKGEIDIVLLMYYGFTQTEIGTILGIPQRTISDRQKKFRKLASVIAKIAL